MSETPDTAGSDDTHEDGLLLGVRAVLSEDDRGKVDLGAIHVLLAEGNDANAAVSRAYQPTAGRRERPLRLTSPGGSTNADRQRDKLTRR